MGVVPDLSLSADNDDLPIGFVDTAAAPLLTFLDEAAFEAVTSPATSGTDVSVEAFVLDFRFTGVSILLVVSSFRPVFAFGVLAFFGSAASVIAGSSTSVFFGRPRLLFATGSDIAILIDKQEA